MNRILTLLFATLLLTTLSAQEKKDRFDIPWKNGKLKVSDNHRFLQFENGKPFFWLGETAWLLPSRSNREEASYFLGETAKNGFNVVQISILHDINAMNAYGQWALPNGFDFKNIDKKGEYNYWQHVDYIVKEAEKRGLYIGLVCVWGGNVKAGLVSVDDAKKYGKFLAERYKDAPNVIWIIGGDQPGSIKPEVWEAMATTIKGIDKNHLMTYHPFAGQLPQHGSTMLRGSISTCSSRDTAVTDR